MCAATPPTPNDFEELESKALNFCFAKLSASCYDTTGNRDTRLIRFRSYWNQPFQREKLLL